MKQRLYVFSDTLLRRKQNTLFFETMQNEDNEVTEFSKEEYFLNNNDYFPTGDKKYIPVENIDSIFAVGSVRFSSRFLYFLSQNHIPLHVISYRGNYAGSFSPAEKAVSGSLLMQQAAFCNNAEKRLFIAKRFIDASVHNILANLKYHYKRGRNLNEYIDSINDIKTEIFTCSSIHELMGIEGFSRKIYYEAWREIFKYPIAFYKRIKNPPSDMINSLISYGNSIVYGICLNEIYHTRLYPEIGFVHEPGDAKLSLSYDIADIFKPLITDRVIFKVINKDMISEKDFITRNGFCRIKKAAKKIFAQEFENKINTKIALPNLSRKVSYKSVIRQECYNLIKHLKSQTIYVPYKTKW